MAIFFIQLFLFLPIFQALSRIFFKVPFSLICLSSILYRILFTKISSFLSSFFFYRGLNRNVYIIEFLVSVNIHKVYAVTEFVAFYGKTVLLYLLLKQFQNIFNQTGASVIIGHKIILLAFGSVLAQVVQFSSLANW